MIFSGESRGTLTKIKSKVKMLSITNTINFGLEIPVNIIRQQKEMGDVKLRNKMIKLPIFWQTE